MYKKLKERITETTQYYLLRNVHPRAEQPFQVRDDEEMQELVESIRMNGVLNPLIVTPRRGGYEIVSGHRPLCRLSEARCGDHSRYCS